MASITATTVTLQTMKQRAREKEATMFVSNRKAIEFINKAPIDSPILLTIGLSYMNPRTHNKPLTHEEAIEWVETHGGEYHIKAFTRNGDHHLNAYTDNYLW